MTDTSLRLDRVESSPRPGTASNCPKRLFYLKPQILLVKTPLYNIPDRARSAETDRTSGSSRLSESSRPGVPGSTDLDLFLERLSRSFKVRKKERLRERPRLRSIGIRNTSNHSYVHQ